MALSGLVVSKVTPLTPKSAGTRARLIATAERLFAERGIEGVSLNDINVAAGQRNKNATHYHFGDKNGLLQAIFDKHLPGITLRRERLLDEAEAQGRYTAVGVVRALLYPMAEKLFDNDGGREFVRINAQLAASIAAILNKSEREPLQLGQLERLHAARAQFLGHLPDAVARQRVTLTTSLILNALADHSRLLESSPNDPAADTELLIRNLEDCLIAICDAPVSVAVADVLHKAGAARGATFTTDKTHQK